MERFAPSACVASRGGNVSPKNGRESFLWIIWKLAAMERQFAAIFLGKLMTFETTLAQLTSRCQREYSDGRRSALRKIFEGDAHSSRAVVLCVCSVHWVPVAHSTHTAHRWLVCCGNLLRCSSTSLPRNSESKSGSSCWSRKHNGWIEPTLAFLHLNVHQISCCRRIANTCRIQYCELD